MKVLQINCVYASGSTGRMVRDLHRFLTEQGVESQVVYGRGSCVQEAGVMKLCPEWYAKGCNLLSRLRGIPYGGCGLSTRKLLEFLQKEKPDVVHLQCTNGYFVNQYRLLSWLKGRGIRTVLTLHAEFPFTGGCAHAVDCQQWRTGCETCSRWRQEANSWPGDRAAASFWKMQASFAGFEGNLTVVSVSDWLGRRAQQSLILGGMDHRTIHNGVNTAVFHYQKPGKTQKEQVIFHATPLFSDDPAHPKGGWYVLALAERMLGKPVRFLVAGKYKLQGKVPENVTLLGEISEEEAMADLYAQANLTLLTSLRETFSMVCAESLCCGTPVVGFQAGGPEEISLTEFSEFTAPGDLDALEAAVEKWLASSPEKEKISEAAVKAYENRTMLEAYHQLYQECCL